MLADQEFSRHVQWITKQPFKVVSVNERRDADRLSIGEVLILDPLFSECPFLGSHSSVGTTIPVQRHRLDIHIQHSFQIIATVPMNDEAIGGFGLETHLVLLLCGRLRSLDHSSSRSFSICHIVQIKTVEASALDTLVTSHLVNASIDLTDAPRV